MLNSQHVWPTTQPWKYFSVKFYRYAKSILAGQLPPEKDQKWLETLCSDNLEIELRLKVDFEVWTEYHVNPCQFLFDPWLTILFCRLHLVTLFFQARFSIFSFSWLKHKPNFIWITYMTLLVQDIYTFAL